MILRRLARLAVLSPRQHAYLMQAAFHLARARRDFGRQSARDILYALQRQPDPGLPRSNVDVPMVSWAIRAAASGVPWRSDCLIQSMAADRWLRRHGIVAAFRLGVSPSAEGMLLAHAWLELDGIVLTGDDDIAHYEVLIAS
jgi:hypothetical protein